MDDEHVRYAAYVKETTDAGKPVLPFGRWQQWVTENVPRPS